MPPLPPVSAHLSPLVVRRLGLVGYQETFEAMREFTAARHGDTPDEVWLLQHPPTFTQGLNGKAEHLLAPGSIPLIQVDRGGQVTYHGPGQLIAYLLLDLRRRKMGVRQLVSVMEQAAINLLADYGIEAGARPEAPGVYVGATKIAALGLRVKRGCSYHGLSLNIAMDLSPFTRINPCGYHGMAVTDLRTLGINVGLEPITERLLEKLQQELGTCATHSAPAL